MKRILAALAFVAVLISPALAGGDWDDDDYYEYEARPWRDGYRAYSYEAVPAYRVPSYGYYVPYDTYYADEPDDYGPNCKVERRWRHGHYREKIECDDED